jgi:hypothetical protein
MVDTGKYKECTTKKKKEAEANRPGNYIVHTDKRKEYSKKIRKTIDILAVALVL